MSIPLSSTEHQQIETRALVLDIVSDIEAIRDEWIDLEQRTGCSIYQRYGFIQPWLETEGADSSAKAAIITGRLNGKLVLVIPTASVDFGPFRVLRFLCGTHSNTNLALVDRSIITSQDDKRLRQHILEVCKARKIADILAFMNMPDKWNDDPNLLMFREASIAPHGCYLGALDADYEQLFAKRRGKKSQQTVKRKLRKLHEKGNVEFREITDIVESHHVVDVFIEQKCNRFRRMGIDNTFERASAQQFLHRLVDQSVNLDWALLELCVLEIDGEISAIFGGASHQGRFSSYISSFREGELAKFGLAEHLLNFQVERCCKRGVQVFDLGVGFASYKTIWCKEVEKLYDVYWPLTLAGYVPYMLFKFQLAYRQLARKHPKLLFQVNKFRRLLSQLTGRR